MPFDAIFLSAVTQELQQPLQGAKVDKIYQPERDTLVLQLRGSQGAKRLLLTASPAHPRLQLTALSLENPAQPPMFCMLLRKHLGGGRVLDVRRMAGDRILEIDIGTLSELGDAVTRTLVVEIMGRHSNIILRADDGRIIDAVRHVGEDISRVRLVLPGLPYAYPPSQGKLDPDRADTAALAVGLLAAGGRLEKAISRTVAGFSLQAGREAAVRIGLDPDTLLSETDAPHVARALHDYLEAMPSLSPCVVTIGEDGSPSDVFPFPQMHLPLEKTRRYPSPSAALDDYFFERDRRERMAQRASSLAHTLKNHIERCEKKIAIQNEALAGAQRMDEYRQNGELIQANLYRLKKGEPFAEVENYYEEGCPLVRIPMDVSLSPAQNAQRYFKLYQKARGARLLAAEQKQKAEQELLYLEQMEDDLRKCADARELAELREMLIASGHVRKTVQRVKPRREEPSQPMKFLSSDGIEIEVGKNALQNERLTLGARGSELWLHAQKMPGSHVIVHAEDVPENTLMEAAMLAAYYSKGIHSAQVPIDATLRRHIKKPGGTPAGFVTYAHQRTLYITPSEAAVRQIHKIRE